MAHPLVFTSSLRLMGRLAEEVGGFQECAHGDGELRGGGQDDAEEFFRRTTIGRLAFPPAIKGLRPAEKIFFGEMAAHNVKNALSLPCNSLSVQTIQQDRLFFGDLSEDDRIELVTYKEAAVPHRVKERSDCREQATLFCHHE